MPYPRSNRFAWISLLGLSVLPIAGCSDSVPSQPASEPPPTIRAAIDPGPYTPGQSYFGRNDYIEYVAGNAPVILSAPHGGDLEPSEIPDRTGGACGGSATTVRDLNTRELALAMQQKFFERFGTYPHVIINHLRRTKLDANRDIVEGACGDPEAETAWTEFHDFIDVAKDAVLQSEGKGWYMDMHGHGHEVQRLELGYLLSGSQLDRSDATLDGDPAYQDTSSFKTMSEDDTTHSLSELLRGPTSLGTLYDDNGFRSIPSSSDRSPEGNAYFSGGYNTRRHGCGVEAGPRGGVPGGNICGVQIEANYDGVRDDATNRDAFGAATAIVLEDYLTHWGITLGGTPANDPPVADFTHACTDLACDFTDASADSDGSIISWSWDFGDTGTSTARNPSHTYTSAGDYTVTLTVTDDSAAVDSVSRVVSVTAPPSGISLQATGYKVKGVQHADLTWSGAGSTDVDVYRDGIVVATTPNDGAHTDSTGQKGGGSSTYRICDAGTSTCSNTVNVSF